MGPPHFGMAPAGLGGRVWGRHSHDVRPDYGSRKSAVHDGEATAAGSRWPASTRARSDRAHPWWHPPDNTWDICKHGGLDYREATAGDAEAIAGLHADSWRRHYRGAYLDSYLDSDVADRMAEWSGRLGWTGIPSSRIVVAPSRASLIPSSMLTRPGVPFSTTPMSDMTSSVRESVPGFWPRPRERLSGAVRRPGFTRGCLNRTRRPRRSTGARRRLRRARARRARAGRRPELLDLGPDIGLGVEPGPGDRRPRGYGPGSPRSTSAHGASGGRTTPAATGSSPRQSTPAPSTWPGSPPEPLPATGVRRYGRR
jgi:hypothetical protein